MPPLRCAKCSSECKKKMVCSKCKAVNYCSKECQEGHWRIHKDMCEPFDPDMVWAIKILCDTEFESLGTEDEMKRLQHTRIPKAHPIFDKGEKCPVLTTCGIPLLIYSKNIHDRESPTVCNSELFNQAAFTFRMDLHDIYSCIPRPWQIIPPGTCIVARSDHRPLTREAAETMLEWTMRIVFESFAHPTSDGWAPTWQLLTPASFQLFSCEYYEIQRVVMQRRGFDKFSTPL